MRIQYKCPHCKKSTAITDKLLVLDSSNTIFYSLQCGHYIVETREVKLEANPGHYLVCRTHRKHLGAESLAVGHCHDQEESSCSLIQVPTQYDPSWIDLYPYQRIGVQRMVDSNFRHLLADDMGLGKTIQAAFILRSFPQFLLPALVVCPAQLTTNWQRHLSNWYTKKFQTFESVPLIVSGAVGFIGQQDIYICSSAILARDNIVAEIKRRGFKTLIIDECHQFKNDNASRTAALLEIAGGIKYRIALSGTPITNRVMEYDNTLRLIRHEDWPHSGHLANLCVQDSRGRRICLSEAGRERFFRKTKDYITRRTQKEALPDLPPMVVNPTYCDICNDKSTVEAYNKLADELRKLLDTLGTKNSQNGYMDILSLLSRLRHIIGLSKIKHAVDHASEFLENVNEGAKLCLGVHHQDVRGLLKTMLSTELLRLNEEQDKTYESALEVSSENPVRKDEIIAEFSNNPNRRVLIASVLGCGEGRDITACRNAILVERQWNMAKEIQFFKRFHRIGTTDKVIIDILVAVDTVDEFFHDLVQAKGAIVDSTLEYNFEGNVDDIIALAEKATQKRLQYVG